MVNKIGEEIFSCILFDRLWGFAQRKKTIVSIVWEDFSRPVRFKAAHAYPYRDKAIWMHFVQ